MWLYRVPGLTPSSLAIAVMLFSGLRSMSQAARSSSGGDHGGPAADPAAGAGGGQAFAGAGDDQFADELGQGSEDDEPAAGGGGVEVLVQAGEPDTAAA